MVDIKCINCYTIKKEKWQFKFNLVLDKILVKVYGDDIMRYLSDSEYDEEMRKLGFVMDEENGKYFLNGMAYIMNVGDDIEVVGDLLEFNSEGNHPTFLAESVMRMSFSGAKLAIGPGGIDGYGVKYRKALYCTNYYELYPKKVDSAMKK